MGQLNHKTKSLLKQTEWFLYTQRPKTQDQKGFYMRTSNKLISTLKQQKKNKSTQPPQDLVVMIGDSSKVHESHRDVIMAL